MRSWRIDGVVAVLDVVAVVVVVVEAVVVVVVGGVEYSWW